MSKPEIVIAVAASAAIMALCGCATTQYGDGKIGPVSMDPAVQSLATALDARAPGTGEYVRKWFATSGVDRVPPGYVIRWTSYLDGKAIDEAAIVRVPTLAPKAAGPVMPVEVASPDAPVDLGAILQDIGNASK